MLYWGVSRGLFRIANETDGKTVVSRAGILWVHEIVTIPIDQMVRIVTIIVRTRPVEPSRTNIVRSRTSSIARSWQEHTTGSLKRCPTRCGALCAPITFLVDGTPCNTIRSAQSVVVREYDNAVHTYAVGVDGCIRITSIGCAVHG